MNDYNEPIIHLDLSNLRDNSMGDEEFVREILELFVSQSKERIVQLNAEITDGANEQWVSHAHALKGMAANIGALHLRRLCADAQLMADTTAAQRADILNKIKSELEIVLSELNSEN